MPRFSFYSDLVFLDEFPEWVVTPSVNPLGPELKDSVVFGNRVYPAS